MSPKGGRLTIYNGAADQKFILAPNHLVLCNLTALFQSQFFDGQEASGRI